MEDSMSTDKGDLSFTPMADFATFSTQTKRQGLILTVTMGILFVALIASVLGVMAWSGGLQGAMRSLLDHGLQSQQATFAMAKKICDVDTNYLFAEHCSAQQPLDRQKLCFLMIGRVEEIIHYRSKDAIFAALAALEPQTGPINYWGVDENSMNEDSHLDKFTNDMVSFFNNTAYYYAQKVHMESVPCGGWSMSYWRNMNATVDLDLVYCEHVSSNTGQASEYTSDGVRVCGAFKLSSFDV